MEVKSINQEKIIARLRLYNYDFEQNGDVMKIYLPMFCFLKLRFENEKVKLTSHIRFGFHFLTLEWNFIIYGLILYLLTWFQWPELNKGIFMLFGIFLLIFMICIIKIESMKIIVHSWIEKDSFI
jgi:hypothetical protein